MTSIWEHPFVDIFKSFLVKQWKNAKKSGDVTFELDQNIGREVYLIKGKTSSINFIEIPKPNSKIKSLGIKGKYIYFFLKPLGASLPFTIHLDFTIPNSNGFRLSFSNMYKAPEVKPFSVLLPIKLEDSKWTCMCVDAYYLIDKYRKREVKEKVTPPQTLKTIILCANLKISKIMTSNTAYRYEELPRDVNFRVKRGEQWRDVYAWIYYGEEGKEHGENLETEGNEESKAVFIKKGKNLEDSEMKNLLGSKEFVDKTFTKSDLFNSAIYDEMRGGGGEQKSKVYKATMGLGHKPGLLNKENINNANKADQIQSPPHGLFSPPDFDKTGPAKKLTPDPILDLKRVIGYNGFSCPNLLWRKDPQKRNIIFASGSAVIQMDINTQQQQFFLGHSAPICAFTMDPSGTMLATGQEGQNPIIRIWDLKTRTCICSVGSCVKCLQFLSFSCNGEYLASVGKDSHNREQIIVWNISNISQGQKPKIIAKQLSYFNILCLKFSPIDSDKLCSCGQENIRFWRIKNGHLPGSAVVLNKHSRDTVFSCLDYEFGSSSTNVVENEALKRVFAGSKHGMVFQINYHTHELEGVFQLHNAAIHSIALNEAFCVTGSSDNILRVWPLDFSEFFLEAKHEGTVTAIDITQDGIQVICGTEIGSIGLLDIAQQNYKTLLRSHTKGIRSLELHTNRNNLLTLSEDNTIRIWDLETYDEVYEFCSFEDKPLCLAAHPSLPLFACGFQSGTLRIFDIQRTTVVEEYRQFDKPLVKLKYAPNEGLLVCVAQDGYVCIHNAGKAHQPIKTVEVDVAVPFPALQFSFDQAIFLTVGSAGSSVNIWDSRVLATKAVVGIGAAIVKDLKFLNVNHDFVVLLHDNMIKFFTIQGNLLRKFNPGADLNTLTVSNNAMYLAASGNDAIVRIFDAQFPSNTEPDMQAFIGHSGPIKHIQFNSRNPQELLSAGGAEGILIWKFYGNVQEELLIGKAPIPLPKSEMMKSTEIRKELSKKQEYGDSFRNKLERRFLDESEDIDQMNNLDINEATPEPFPSPQPETKPIKQKIDNEQLSSLCNFDGNLNLNLRVSSSLATFGKIEAESPTSLKGFLNNQSEGLTKFKEKKSYGLCFKHFIPSYENKLQFSSQSLIKNVDQLKPELLLGYNGNAHDNIVWNEKKGWMAYSVNNKVIIETVRERSQIILRNHSAEISTLKLSPDKTLLASGTGSVNQEGIAEILLWDLSTPHFKLLKKLSFHHKGVQGLCFSPDSKLLFSLGVYTEANIVCWDIQSGTVLGCANLSHTMNDLICPPNTHSLMQHVILIGQDRIFIYATTNRTLLLQNELIYEDKGKDGRFLFTAAALTQTDQPLLLLGTTEGSIVLFNLLNHQFIHEFPIFEDEITSIVCTKQVVIVGGASNSIFRWNIEQKYPHSEEIGLFETKPQAISLDSNVVAMSFDNEGNEGQVGTDLGRIWYINWGENLAIKLISSHSNSKIKKVCYDNNSPSLLFLSSGTDDMIRIWSVKSCDEIMEFEIPNTECTSMLIATGVNEESIHADTNNLVAGFSDGNLRFYNLKKLQHLGKVKLSSSPITALACTPSGQSILAGDESGKIFLLNVEKWHPFTIKQQQLAFLEERVGCVDFSGIGESKFLGGFENGKILVWERKHTGERSREEDAYTLRKNVEFIVHDVFDIFQNPHQEEGEKDLPQEESKQQLVPSDLYGFTSNHHTCAKFSKNAPHLYICCVQSLQYIIFRDIQNHTVHKRINLLLFPTCFDISADGNILAIGTKEHLIKCFDLQTNQEAAVDAHLDQVYDIAISKDKNNIISSSYSEIIQWHLNFSN